ncbi:VOC family protein [Allobranchiibius sp. GilTou73]|uniref:VOC family protein n=1 Tax=Allobranchiibius sp. GilTou73 TaxID=2904523 RepID=UPI001F29E101|nr:VOC family protein [Allobranchiibius sp. GilTou73]UIJ34907.1 pterin-4-alpha-carbinolamine dehydratase [Allobranchiibius sp. GilTou73]
MTINATQFYAVAPRREWVLVFEGALAHFVCTDAAARVEFAREVVTAAGDALSPDLDLRSGGVTVRLAATFEEGGLPDAAAEVAARISQVAQQLDLPADVSHLQTIQIAIDGGSGAVPFWHAVTGYEQPEDADLIDPLRRGPGVWNQAVNDGREAPARLHVDISVSVEEAPRRVAAALQAGGRVVQDRFAPQWTTLADPDGNLVDIAAWPDLP